MEVELALLSLGISLVLVVFFWPAEKKSWPTQDYLALLSPTQWKEEGELYEKILRLHPMLTPNEHNQILLSLYSENKVDRLVTPPHAIEEIESPNRFGRVYIDHIEPFCTITSVSYKLVHQSGRKQRKFQLPKNPLPAVLWS